MPNTKAIGSLTRSCSGSPSAGNGGVHIEAADVHALTMAIDDAEEAVDQLSR